MPTIDEVRDFMLTVAPPELAEEWDNPGLLVRSGSDAKSILVSLDITAAVVDEAAAKGCGLIVAHHPVIFRPLRSIAQGDVVFRLIQAGISALCAHTNLDAAEGGVNDVLAATLQLQKVEPFGGMGRIGHLQKALPPPAFAAFCAQALGGPVQLANAQSPVRRVAVLGGSGGDFVQKAVEAGADCLLTGDAGHHDALDALQAGISLVAAGHYGTERPVVPALAQKLKERFPQSTVWVSEAESPPMAWVGAPG